MELSRIKREDFSDWNTYYWTYQYNLAEQYYLPRIKSWGVEIKEKKILDIGCGDGGFTSAFGKAGGFCTGVEVREFNWKPSDNVKYIVQDVYKDASVKNIGDDYDLIILRDVIEHIPISQKKQFLQSIINFGTEKTKFLITFPPFYSPFGLHQQTLLKSSLRKLPYLSLLPHTFLSPLLKLFNEDNNTIHNISEIRESRMTMYAFDQLIHEVGLTISEEEYFLIRPSHEIRYGWKMKKFNKNPLKGFRELITLGTCYLLKNSQNML